MADWDVVRREPAQQQGAAADDPWAVSSREPAAAPDLPNRSVSEWMGDTGRRMMQTARTVTGGVLGIPTNLVNTMTANPRRALELGNALRGRLGMEQLDGGMYDLFDALPQPEVVQGIREQLDIANEITGEGMTPQAQRFADELEAADGFLPTIGQFARNPSFAAQEIVGQLPQMLQMVPGSLPGTIAAQMAGIGSQAEQQVFNEAIARGMEEEEAAAAGAEAFGLTAPVGAAGALVPGGLTVERMLTGQLGRTTARNLAARAGITGTAIAGETATETLQEGAEQGIQNYVLGDPITQGIGSAMAQGAVLGAGMGTPAGVAAGALARSPGQGDGSGEGRGTEDPGYRIDPETGALEIDIVGGTRESDAGVQSPQAPSAAMVDTDLAPRVPEAPVIEEGVTREQLVEEWRNAKTPDQQAAAAARIAAHDGRTDDAGAPDSGPVVADGAAGAEAGAAELPAQDRGAPAASSLSPELIEAAGPEAGSTGYVPEGTQAPPEDGASKAYLKQHIDTLPDPTPEQLPDNPSAYFDMRSADEVVPTSSLIPSKQERASATAMRRMAASADGFIPKRGAIDVRINEDGTYTIVDGNGTHAAAQAAGLTQLPVRVVEAPAGREGWRNPRGYLQGEASEALTRLYEVSAEAKPEFDQIIEGIAGEFGAKPTTVPLKGRTRSEQKTRDDYGGDSSRLNDVLRGSITLTNPTDAAQMIDRLRQSGTVIKEKNAFDMSQPSPFWGGYRDAKVVFQMPNGARAEVILMTEEMEAAKARAHKDYEIARVADAAIERGENVQENARAKAEAIARMETVYAPAAEALRRAANSSSDSRQRPSGVNARDRSDSVGVRADGSYTTSTGAPPGPGTNAMGTSLSGGPPNSSEPGGGSAGSGVTPSGNVVADSGTSGTPSSDVSPTAPSVQETGPSEQVQTAVGRVLPRNASATVVRSISDIPQDVRDRVNLTDADTDVEGFYDPDTQSVYVIEGGLAPRSGQPIEARAAWVAAHEWSGHHGLRTLTGSQLGATLRRARNNDTVAAVMRAMERERPERGDALTEEAIVELSAAVRTGDFAEISDRYGVEFTADSRGDLRKLFDRILNALRRALGWDGFTDAELYDLIADSAAAAAGGPETILSGDLAPRSRGRTASPSTSRLLRNLTPAEQKKVTDKVAAKIEEHLTRLPPKREMAAAAVAGKAKRGWYRQSAETISAVFGPDAPLFAGLLSATSPQISVEGNLKNALGIWRDWVAAGRPTGEQEILDVMRSSLKKTFGNSLRAWEPNTVRALQGQGILSGPKVDSFMRNLINDTEEVTNDAWMANFANVNQTIFSGSINVRGTDPGKGSGYLAMNARVREVARELTRMTGETWTPAEVQETIWSWAKTITEMADSATETRSAEELVSDRAVTDELIASTPDFGTLFTMPEYRQILEEAGYGEQLSQIDSQRDSAGAAVQEPEAGGQAGPFAEEDQLRLERRAARRIDALRRSRAEASEVRRGGKPKAAPRSRAAPSRGVHPDAAVTLNIGLSTAELRGGGELSRVRVMRVLRRTGVNVLADSRHVSDSEPTLVVDLDRPLTAEEGREVSAALDQEAIVQRNVDGTGELFGPQAENWGPYNPAYFVMPDGDRADRGPVASRGRNPQVDTPEFRRWFGDSKVVDESGNPLVVYHGTGSDFDSFDSGRAGQNWTEARGGGMFFTASGDIASMYAGSVSARLVGSRVEFDGANVMPVYLSMQNPLIVDSDSEQGAGYYDRNAPRLSREMESGGHDGVIVRASRDGEDTSVFVVFRPEQIKSATGNRGTFDPSDPSIVASRGRRTAAGRRGRTAQAFSGKPRQPDAVSADAYHYSSTPGLTELDPTFAGTAGAGRERRAFGMGRFGERGGTYARLNFYVREQGAEVPGAEDVVRSAGGSNLYRVQLDNLYDLDADPRGIAEEAGINSTLMEEMIAEAGYDGFLAGPQPGIDTPVAVVFDIDQTVPVENVDGSEALPPAQAEPEPEDPNAWLERYEASRRGPIASRRRTAADAMQERGKLFGRLAADGYRMGSPTQTAPGGRFATVKQARDAALTALHDKMTPLLRVQQQVSGDGRGISSLTLDDAMNAYRAENLMHGAVNNELTGLHYNHIRPIQEALRKSPYSVEMFEDYLYAKAAPERNREVAKINKAMPDGGSGITTQMANDIMAGKAEGVFSGKALTPEAIALFDDLNKHVRALRTAALDNMVDAGQITPELAAALRKKYPNYVPMRGKDAELDAGRGSGSGSGRGLSQRRANIKRALGRGADNVPINILGELVGDAQRSVVAKGKAKVARAMLRFALANPNPDLYTVEPVDMEWRFSEATGEAYLGVKRRGEDVDTSMVVMHRGQPVHLRINDPTLRESVLNASVEDMGKIMRIFSALNRWRSATLTRYNPAFTPVNMARDFHFGTVAIAAEHGAKIAAQTVMNYPSAMRAAYRHAGGNRGDASKPDAEKTMQDWAAEAYSAGMSTGITHTPNVVDLQRNLQAATMGIIELAASGRPLAATGQALLRTGRPIIDAIENANEASENAMRLGVYVALRKSGMSVDRAAEYGKNVTINFNRKGKAGPILNAIFLFYNAAMQGGHAVLRVMRNPKVMVYLTGLSVMQGLLSAGMMDDDDGDGVTEWDKIPDYVKRTSLVIPVGEDRYFAMPMPYGFNWFTYLGGRGTQRMVLGDRPTDSSITVDLAKSLSEAFAPIPLQDGYRSLFGDQVGLAMGLAANRDDFGSPIAQLNPYEQYPEPRALQGKVSTPQMYHVMAQLMAKAGGGDLDERLPPIGWLDVAPEQIEEVVNHFGGGVTSLGNRALRSFEQMQAGNLDGVFEKLSSAPITSRLLVTPRDSFAIADRYYSERGEFARHKEIVDSRIAQGMSLDEALSDRPPEYFTGAEQATYKRHGRRQDGTRYRRGEPRVDAAGKPIVEYTEGSPRDVQKRVDRRVKALNDAVREIRAATMTNAELAEMYSTHYDAHSSGLGESGAIDGVTGLHTDLGLPDDFDGEAKAPARVRNRAIKIMQDMRALEQRRLLRSIEYERKLQGSR